MSDAKPATLLDHAYASLGFDAGTLLPTTASPKGVQDPTDWRDHGDWLLLGERLGAERIFFVGGDPVLVFSRVPSGAGEQEIMDLYRRAWSMARPRCLFVDAGDALRVYNLDAPPPVPGAAAKTITPIDVVERAADVQHALARFQRDRFESGAALEDGALAPSAGRADRRLLRDVQVATGALQDAGLTPRAAHALIERAVLVRYLEDRGVLTNRYFDELVSEYPKSASKLDTLDSAPDFGAPSRFIDFLSDRQLTQALFERLARDFNGDLFADVAATNERHLSLLRDLLRGAALSGQEQLFLWAYDFSVVPTSLVSSMYELFYNQEAHGAASSTYYTPPELVEFVLGDVLDTQVLDEEPVACDPACGSGIFLVEAYRRIVRHEAARVGRRLSSRRLQQLLLERIAGCDVDESAVRLAAFSLYVAYLNYQTPSDIQEAGPLPPLIHRAQNGKGGRAAPLVIADAFSPLSGEDHEPRESSAGAGLPWEPRSFDVVLGNPPWTEPRGGPRSLGERWAHRRGLPLGDRSPSQLFLWRALDLLAPTGIAAMLVSAKVLFNTRTTSRAFRQEWLSAVRLGRVVNFSEVRHDFFERAVAPFALMRFGHSGGPLTESVIYETARPVASGRRGSAALARLDRRLVDQRSFIAHDFLWKTYSAGDHRDEAFIARLGLELRLGDLRPAAPKAQYGYQRSSRDERAGHPTPAAWRNLQSLRKFESWGPIRDEWLEPVTPYVKFDPDPALFLDRTLAIYRFVSPSFGPPARLLCEPLAFRHNTYGIPLGHREEWEAKVALGTLLSSIGRYWLFMVSGSWGTWIDEVRAEQLLELPIRLDANHPATQRILSAVDRLPRVVEPAELSLAGEHDVILEGVLRDLDSAVSELFDLTPAERDLVADFWSGRRADGEAPLDLDVASDGVGRLFGRYADVFRRGWRSILAEAVELDAHFAQDEHARVVAAVFETRDLTASPTTDVIDTARWTSVLEQYTGSLDARTSHRLLAHGELRAVTPSAIVIVKRNERRLWSPTAARQDAEATAAQTLALQRANA
jgi:hypothetical protein